MKILKISDHKSIEPILHRASDIVESALDGGPVEIRIMRESKSRIQEAKYHALISDIAKTVELEGRYYDTETWKALLVDAFEEEKKSLGEPLTHPGRRCMSLDGNRFVTIRASTTEFRKQEASDFITFLIMTGTGYGARFTATEYD